jgi:hypothetical protein
MFMLLSSFLNGWLWYIIIHGTEEKGPGWWWLNLEAAADLPQEVWRVGSDSFQTIPQQSRRGTGGWPTSPQKGNWHIIQLMFWEEVGMVGTQAIFDSLC